LGVFASLDLFFNLGLRYEVGWGGLNVRDVGDTVVSWFRRALFPESGVL